MCCCGNSNNWSSCGCGCGCGGSWDSCGCGCGSSNSCGSGSGCGCGGSGGVTTLPSFPDRPVWDGSGSADMPDYPVYVSLPAYMTRGSANLRAAVDLDSGCPFARG